MKKLTKKTLSLILTLSMLLTAVPQSSQVAASDPGALLMELTKVYATAAESGNKFTATGGILAASAELTAWDDNEQITIGGTGRTPIVINNAALKTATGWQAASVVGVDNATAFQIKFSTAGHSGIKFSSTQKSTGSGPDLFKLAYRVGTGGTFTPIANSETEVRRASNDTYDALRQTYYRFELPAAVDDQAEVYLRVYFDGLTDLGRNGNTSINDIRITTGDYDPNSSNKTDRPDHIIINQVYGNGDDSRSDVPTISNSFIELYNPTSTSVSLSGKSLQYMKGIERGVGSFGDWQVLPLSGFIPANSSFLIVSDVGVSNSPSRYSIPNSDMVWNIPFSNRAFSIALVNGTAAISGNTATNTLVGDIIDLVGVSNSVANGDIAPFFEYRSFNDISMQASARRKDFADFDENRNDFERIDYRATGISNDVFEEVKPRYSGDGAWGEDIYPTFRIREGGSLAFSKPSGLYDSPFGLTLSTEHQNAEIRYTLDGSEPTNASPVYSSAISMTNRTGVVNPNFTNAKSCIITVTGTTSTTVKRLVLEQTEDPWGNIKPYSPVTANVSGSAFTLTTTLTPQEVYNIKGNITIRTECWDNYGIWLVCDPELNWQGCKCSYSITGITIKNAANSSDVLYDMQDDNLDMSLGASGSGMLLADGAFINVTGSYPNKIIHLPNRDAGWRTVNIAKDSVLVKLLEPAYNSDFLALKAPRIPWGKSVSKGTVVRARAFDQTTGEPLTDIITHTYLIGLQNNYPNLPVISLTTDSDNLFDPDKGIYNNSMERGAEWEVPVHFEIIEPSSSGLSGISQDMGLRIHGNYSRSQPQKSFRLYARGGGLKYNLLNGASVDSNGNTVTSFDRFLLRPGGNDTGMAMMTDALMQSRAHDLNMLYQSSRACVVFVNGEFWGFNWIQERVDDRFVASKANVNREDVSLFKHAFSVIPEEVHENLPENFVVDGKTTQEIINAITDPVIKNDYIDYLEMRTWFENIGVMSDTEYQEAQKYLDMDNFIDYWALQMIAQNTDWPANNLFMWRNRTDSYPNANAPVAMNDGRWRYILNDLDSPFEFWGEGQYANILQGILDDTLTNPTRSNPDWSTLLFRKLMSNEKFKAAFITRTMDLLNTNFRPSTMEREVNAYEAIMTPVMQEQRNRWHVDEWMLEGQPTQFDGWKFQVNKLRTRGMARQADYLSQIGNYFGLYGTRLLNTSVNNGNYGHIKVNTVDIVSTKDGVNSFPNWTGTYLNGTTHTVTAVAAKGYQFQKFIIDGSDVTDNPASFTINWSDVIVQAVFEPSPTAGAEAELAKLTNALTAAIEIELDDSGAETAAIAALTAKANTIIAAGYTATFTVTGYTNGKLTGKFTVSQDGAAVNTATHTEDIEFTITSSHGKPPETTTSATSATTPATTTTNTGTTTTPATTTTNTGTTTTPATTTTGTGTTSTPATTTTGTGTTTTPATTTTGTGTTTTTATTTTGTGTTTTPATTTTNTGTTTTPATTTTGTGTTTTPATTTTNTGTTSTPATTTTGTGTTTTPATTTTETGTTTTSANTTATPENTTMPPTTSTTPSVPNCGNCDRIDCENCNPDGTFHALGDIDGNKTVDIFDALEILKYLVGMNNATQNSPEALRAAIISENATEPSIFCALEVLKFLVNMNCKVDGIHRHGTPTA